MQQSDLSLVMILTHISFVALDTWCVLQIPACIIIISCIIIIMQCCFCPFYLTMVILTLVVGSVAAGMSGPVSI